jgi:hypothetical protein
MHERFENAINRGLRNIRPLVDGLERERALLVLQEFENIERFRQHGN